MTNNIPKEHNPTNNFGVPDFLLEFSKNPFALLGFIILTGVVLSILFIPWVYKNSPNELYPWIGAEPPGTKHPECLVENSFELNRPPQVPPRLLKGRSLEFFTSKPLTKKFRLAIRNKKVFTITQIEGALPVHEIDLTSEPGICREFYLEGGHGRILPKVKLRVGDSPPSNFLAQGQRVMFFEILTGKIESICSVTLNSGIVESLSKDGRALEKISISGESIVKVTMDSKEMIRTSILGTDDLGRDLLSRIVYGGRISLMIGITATFISLLIGVIYGATSAYLGGRVDRIMMGFIDILYALPFMFLVIILLVLFGRSLLILFVALGAVQWLTMARIIRGQILSIKGMDFVFAAQICGAGFFKILFKHLLPNSIGPMIVYSALTVPAVILEESFLSFLGLSVQYKGQNLDSWGALVFQGMQSLGSDGSKSWLLIWPATAMIVTLFGLNVLGDGLRDLFDPKGKKSY